MCNRQTCIVGNLHLIRAVVLLLDVHPAHVVGEMIRGTGIEEPRLTGGRLVRGRIASTIFVVLKRVVVALFALESLMPPVPANLTAGVLASVVAPATVVALSSSSVARTTAPLVGAVVTAGGLLAAVVLAASVRASRTTPAAAVVGGVGEDAPPSTAVALPSHGISGGGELGGEGVLLLEGFTGEEHGIEVRQAEVFSAGGSQYHERVLEGLVPRSEIGDDVVDHLSIGERRPHLGHGVRETLHLVKVGGGGEVVLLQRRELTPHLAYPFPVLRREHGLEARPHRGRGGVADDMAEDLLRHGADEDAENMLIRVEPQGVLRIGLGHGLGTVSFGDRGRRRSVGAVQEAVPALPGDVGDDLHLPEKKIGAI